MPGSAWVVTVQVPEVVVPIRIVPATDAPYVPLEVVLSTIAAFWGTALFKLIALPLAVAVKPDVNCVTELDVSIPAKVTLLLLRVLVLVTVDAVGFVKLKALGLGLEGAVTVSVIVLMRPSTPLRPELIL